MISVSFQGSNNDDVDDGNRESEIFSGTNNSIFTMKVHQKKNYLNDQSGHEVIFNVTFAIAVPGVFTSSKFRESFSTRTSFSDQTTRNVQQFYHLEFNLFSQDIVKEPYKTDIGFYGTYAKIYPDKSESKVIPTWTDGEDTWISWIQQYRVWIVDSHIRDLCSHKMKVTVWDTKDKCLPKVRFDRPKPPRSASKSKSTNENLSWIKQTVLMISKDFSLTSSYKENSDRILPHQIVESQNLKKTDEKNTRSPKHSSTTKSSVSSPELKIKETESMVLYAEPKLDSNSRMESYGQLEKLLEPSHVASAVKGSSAHFISNTKSNLSPLKLLETNLIPPSESKILSQSRKSIILLSENDNYIKTGRTSLEINLADLFQNSRTLSRIGNSFSSIEDMFSQVSIESDVLSPAQRKRLNPLVIKLKRLNNLPISKDKIREINEKYQPAFFEYRFSDFSKYRTLSRLSNRKMHFDDVNIILLGDMKEIKIREQFLNSFFVIEFFNRIKQEPNLNIETDEIISNIKSGQDIGNVNLTSSCKMVTSITAPKPQGESKINLSDIINKNLKFLELTVPIVPVPMLTVKDDNENGTKLYEEDQNNFIDAGTTIKISFQLSESLNIDLNKKDNCEYFTKIIVINNDINCGFLREKMSENILKYNCEKLDFIDRDNSKMQTFLYSLRNSPNELTDILTGFYLIDSKSEILCIESPEKSVKIIYEKISELLNFYQKTNDSINVKVLYNDTLKFKEKEYPSILTMIPLILSKDIDFFASQPLLYVRDIVPKNCVEGICRLKNLLLAESMQVVIRNNLIPTNQMIEDLSQYLCSHVKSKTENFSSQNVIKAKTERKLIKTAPVKSERKLIQNDNSTRTKTQMSIKFIYPEIGREFSYSCQSKNSVASALKGIRNSMDPKRRYTYSQDYLFSGSVDPIDLDEFYADEERKSRSESKWTTKTCKTEVEDCSISNLTTQRIEDLKEPWIENELHANSMRPTLPERDKPDRKFDNYIRPLNLLERNSVSIMPSYFIHKQDEKFKRQMEYSDWKSKVCVSNPKFNVHRLLTQSELTASGPKSSNQIFKLHGLRKDKLDIVNVIVRKYGDINDIPSLNVLSIDEPQSFSFTVGPEINKNLSVNYIPINRKDINFRTVYNSKRDSPTCKHQIPERLTKGFPFSMSC